MSVVEFDHVTIHFGALRVLHDIGFSVEAGEVVGLFGHNGAGKTTTMKLILGLLHPDHGQVRVMGQDPASKKFLPNRFEIGFLPENVVFYPQLTGREVIRFFGRLKGVKAERCGQLLQEVGLATAACRKVKTYSKGMRQRLGLAQALLTEPRLLLLDEPTAGLDPVATSRFYRIVDTLRSQGCAIILCSHVLPGVEAHIDRAAILSAGELQACGHLDDLRKQANLPLKIRAFYSASDGSLEKNMVRLGYTVNSINCGGIELSIKAEHKIKVLRELLAQPDLCDVEFNYPSLETIYRHFVHDVDEVQFGSEPR